ncbi:MAG: putative Na+/H+ antiporter [Hyphomicrobiales bacterium]
MNRATRLRLGMVMLLSCAIGLGIAVRVGATATPAEEGHFPHNLESYGDQDMTGIMEILRHRAQAEPFNLAATLIFFGAIVHTFLSSKFMSRAHRWEHQHAEKIRQGLAAQHSVHYGAELFHFLGEVEVIFGLWGIALIAAIIGFHDWATVVEYIGTQVNFTEPLFVVVIMTLAATRPILKVSELAMQKIAAVLGGSLTAWWFTILTLGPLLGSFITEPAAMTICALLLSRKFYDLGPGARFKYATIGLLFVNISVGGTLTHFAAPPVLMVAAPWQWGPVHMLTQFGWKAVLGILVANGMYLAVFRKELSAMQHDFALQALKDKIQTELLKRQDLEAEIDRIGPEADQELKFRQVVEQGLNQIIGHVKARLEAEYLPKLIKPGADAELIREAFEKRFEEIKLKRMRRDLPRLLPEEERPPFIDPDWDQRDDPVPAWIIVVHVLFMVWTIANAHHPELFVPGLLFFLGFGQVTAPFQNRINLKPPLLVGFFLGGLVVHGGVQGWWIEPMLGHLSEIPLMLSATILTAFNDNAAITFLSTLVPGFTGGLKYAVVAGAVAGGGLTVIANAPNPAGQAILKKHFENGVSPAGLVKAAIAPTAILWLMFLALA